MNSSCTDTKVHQIEYQWVIRNFNLHLQHAQAEKDIFMMSSYFVDENSNTKWYLELRIFGKEHEKRDFIGLTFGVEITDELIKIPASRTIYFVNNENKRIKVCQFGMKNFTKSMCRWGTYELYNKKKLSEQASIFMPHDNLTIFCQINILGERTTSITTNIHHVIKNERKNPKSDITKLFVAKEYTDVTFVVRGKKIEAHKLILRACSPIFAAIFDHRTRRQQSNSQIRVDDVEPKIFEKLMLYIYSDEVLGLDDSARDLLPAADKYQLEELKEMCEESLCKNLTIDNTAEVLMLARRHNAKRLLEYTQNFMNIWISDIVGTPGYDILKKEYPELGFLLYQTLAMKSQVNEK